MQLTLHLTNACNLRCSYCYQTHDPAHMSLETAQAAIDLASENCDHVGIGFYGGEPMLEKDLIYQIVEYCNHLKNTKKKRYSFQMTTNGTLLEEEFLRFAKKQPLILAVSYDGNLQQRLNVNGEPVAGFVKDKLQLALRYLPYTPVMMTISPQEVQSFSENVRSLIEKMGVRYVLASPAYGKEIKWTDEAFHELKRQFKLLAELYEAWMCEGRRFYFGPFEAKIMSYLRDEDCYLPQCGLGKHHIAVAADGQIYPCTQFTGNALYWMGTVQDGIDPSALSRIASLYTEQPDCNLCAIKKRCRHTCGCANLLGSGDAFRTSAMQCEYERMLVSFSDGIGKRLYRSKNSQFLKMHYDPNYALLSLIEDRLR